MTIADLNTLTRYLCNADSTSLTAANLLIFINKAYERMIGKLITITGDGPWPFGDSNYTAFPTYTMNLTNSTAEYQIDSLTTPLTIMAVEVMDQNGNYYPLQTITLRQIEETGTSQTEFEETDRRPIYYEKRENMVVLYPAPDNGVSVTLTAGLKIFFLRTADVYTAAQVTTGTKEPGYPSPWHDILAYEAAIMYCLNFKPERVGFLTQERDKRERELFEFMSMRDQDVRPIMKMKPVSFI